MALVNVIAPPDGWYEITPTIDTSRFYVNSGGYVKCYRNATMCCVEMFNVCFANAGDSQHNVLTGLPKALAQVQGNYFGSNSEETVTIAGCAFWIASGRTSMSVHIKASVNRHNMYGTLIYPCAE